jgi:comEA protein
MAGSQGYTLLASKAARVEPSGSRDANTTLRARSGLPTVRINATKENNMKRFISAIRRCQFLLLLTALFVTTMEVNTLTALAQTKKQPSQTVPASGTKVDMNSADEATLETLPGIGPTLAGRIIAGRPYHNVSDLAKVKGMSQPRIDAIKDEITFGTTTTASHKSTTKKQVPSATEQTTSQPSGAASAPTAGSTPSQATAPSATGRTSSKLAPGQKININTATADELDALPGIGPTKAQAVIDYRNQHGAFKAIEDIQNVKGIKAGEFSKLKDYIVVGP